MKTIQSFTILVLYISGDSDNQLPSLPAKNATIEHQLINLDFDKINVETTDLW